MKRLAIAALAALCTFPMLAALADDAPAPAASPKPTPEPAAAADGVTHHTLVLGGKTYAYTARAGTITLRNDAQQPTARIFYTAYTLDGADASHRPVTFFYNGGPGSSTVFLRMQSFGPVRFEHPNAAPNAGAPYRVVDNPDSLLDKSDLVFIDAPGTGFGRLIGEGKPKDFYGVDQDARAFTQFIERYITRFNRWNSPKFLFGESYGTTRSGALSSVLEGDGVQLSGIVIVSSILDFYLAGSDWNGSSIGGNDWAYVGYLPTEAAAAWYHHAIPNRPASLQSFVAQVEHFASTEYMQALEKGSTISPAEYANVVHKLHDYLGLSEQYIRNANLRIEYYRFENELLRNRGQIVGRYDARYLTDSIDRVADSAPWDPSDSAIEGPFTATFNDYVRNQLDYKPTLPYLVSGPNINQNWDWKHNGLIMTNVAPDLAQAMTTDPHLHLFSANGYYDMATPFFTTQYTLQHLNLAPALQKHVTFGFYESGHMIYMNDDSRHAMHGDLDNWYDSVLSGS